MSVTSYTTTSPTLTVNNLSPSTTYYFTVTAYNGTTPGDSSSVQSTTTQAHNYTFLKLNGKVLYVNNKPAYV